MGYQTNKNRLAPLSDSSLNGLFGVAWLLLLPVLLIGCGGGQAASAAAPTSTTVSALAVPTLVPTTTLQAPMILFVTPPPVRAEEPLSPDSRNIPSVFAGIDRYHDIQATLQVKTLAIPAVFSPEEAAKAVVQIYRCNNGNCDTPVGSGVMIHSSGIIATAYHTLLRNPENPNSGPFDDVDNDDDNTVIAMTVDVGRVAEPRFQARLAATKIDQDLALLQIDRDLQGQPIALDDLNLPALPLADVTNLFDQEFRVLGYPTSGGEPISIDRTNFRRYDDDRSLIVVDRPLEPGHSGGPVLLAQTDGFAVAGIVIRRRTTQGQLAPEGLVRTIDQLQDLLWTPGVTRAWGEGVTARFADETILQFGLSIHSLDLLNQPLRLLFYATDAATDRPWRPVGLNGPLVVWADVDLEGVIAQQMLTLTVPTEELGIAPDHLRFRALLWNRTEGNPLWSEQQGVQAVPINAIVTLEPSTTMPATPTLTSQPTTTSTKIAIPTNTATPTVLVTMTSTPKQLPTMTATPTSDATATAASLLQKAVVATLTAAAPTSTPTPLSIRVKTKTLRVLSGPGLTYEVISSVSRNTELVITGKTHNCEWFQVYYQDFKTGWVSGSEQYVAFNGNCDNISTVVEMTPTPSVTPPLVYTATPTISVKIVPTSSLRIDNTQGCYLFQNQLGAELTFTFTNQETKVITSFKIGKDIEKKECFESGQYIYMIDAPPPWGSTNGEVTINAGDYYTFPVTPAD